MWYGEDYATHLGIDLDGITTEGPTTTVNGGEMSKWFFQKSYPCRYLIKIIPTKERVARLKNFWGYVQVDYHVNLLQFSLPQHDYRVIDQWQRPSENQNGHTYESTDETKMLCQPSTRVVVWHLASLTHILQHSVMDQIGQHVSPWRILLVDCSPRSLANKFAWLFKWAKVGQKSFFVLYWRGSRPILTRLCSG